MLIAIYILSVMSMAESTKSPYIRSALARNLYSKMLSDERMRSMDLNELYQLKAPADLSERAQTLFVQLGPDEDTNQFLNSCHELSDRLIYQVFQEVARTFLGFFLHQTSINGVLNRGRMFVWSKSQAAKLLSSTPDDTFHDASEEIQCGEQQGNVWVKQPHCQPSGVSNPPHSIGASSDAVGDSFEVTHPDSNEGNLPSREIPPWADGHILDVGAGDGHVTQIIADGAASVSATEISRVMRSRLSHKGYRVLDAHSWPDSDPNTYDIITCLNVLDRHFAPKQLLKDMKSKLKTGGILVVALVLPFKPYVEYESSNHLPSESLNVEGTTVERQVTSLIDSVLPSLGFEVQSWTKLPYYCEGDLEQTFYWLEDIVVVAKKTDESEEY